MSAPDVVAWAVTLLCVLIPVAALGAGWSRSRRRAVEAAAVPRRVLSRACHGVAAGHPERPGPPLEHELIWHEDFYDFVAGQLADIEVSGQ